MPNLSGSVYVSCGDAVALYQRFVSKTALQRNMVSLMLAISITEAHYAVHELGALGLGLLTNHEGLYLGNAALAPFLTALNESSASVFVHPSTPYLRINGTFVEANPSMLVSPTHRVEDKRLTLML